MFCKNCGVQTPEGTKFCPNCGTEMEEAVPVTTYQEPIAEPVAEPIAEPVPAERPGLVWGILGLAFGCSFFISFLGIIFSAIGKKKAKKYTEQGYVLAGKDKVGHILSKVGLPVSIVLTVFGAIYYAIMIFAIIGSNM